MRASSTLSTLTWKTESKHVQQAVGRRPLRPPSSQPGRSRGDKVKQFLVMKMVEGLNQMAGLVALPGLFTLDAAQQFVQDAMAREPESNFLIQEVGAA